MNIDTFLDNLKKSKYNKLFKIPKIDKTDDMPHIKNNIYEPHLLHQCDILYLPTSQFGYKYCLVCVDVYNSKIDAIALKKKDSNTIVKGLQTIYTKNNILELPVTIQFDSGTEFKNKDVKQLMKQLEADVKYTLVNRHRQNSVVEMANFRLGTLILQFQAVQELKTNKQSKAWHMNLPKFISYLNKNIKQPKNKYDPFADVTGNNDRIKLLNIGETVRKILDYPIDASNNKRIDSKFRSGDIRFSKDKFKIMHIILNPKMPPLYMINILGSDKINSSVAYTRSQLLVA